MPVAAREAVGPLLTLVRRFLLLMTLDLLEAVDVDVLLEQTTGLLESVADVRSPKATRRGTPQADGEDRVEITFMLMSHDESSAADRAGDLAALLRTELPHGLLVVIHRARPLALGDH